MIKITDHDDPERCVTTTATGQCMYKVVPGQRNCERHGGIGQAKREERQKTHDYDIKKWMGRIDALAGSTNILRLNGEIALARMTLETLLGTIDNANQMVPHVGPIQSLIITIKSCVDAAAKQEERSGKVLSLTQVQALAQETLTIILKYVSEEHRTAATTEMLRLIERTQSQESPEA